MATPRVNLTGLPLSPTHSHHHHRTAQDSLAQQPHFHQVVQACQDAQAVVPKAAPCHPGQDDKGDDARPRILCLHGGGVNAKVFRAQCRALIRSLPGFRLVFADAPHVSEAGPGILPVYEGWGPFRRWLRWKPHHAHLTPADAAGSIISSLELCKSKDEGTGPWVGLLGFSQGAKVAASVLYECQLQQEVGHRCLPANGNVNANYRFAVLMAGRAPLLSLSPHSADPALMLPNDISTEELDYPFKSPHIIRMPTIHVHGLQDRDIDWHRKLASQYCHPHAVTIVQWHGEHRVPAKPEDVLQIAREICRVAKKEGVQF